MQRPLALVLVLMSFAGCDCAGPATPGGEGEGEGEGLNLPGSPTTTVTAPADGAFVQTGAATVFTCTAVDDADGPIPNGSIRWLSSVDGELGAGATIQNALITAGDHEIACLAIDSDGLTGADSILVHVVDRLPPTVTITAPADGAFFGVAQSITFAGRAVDANGAAIGNAGLRWLDGATQLGSGAALTTVLGAGVHVVALEATDADGVVGRATVTVQVVDNVPPACSIIVPSDGATVAAGQSTRFTASCPNSDGPPVENAAVRWESSRVVGVIGRGLSIQNALVERGAHVITVCAPDPADAAVEGCDSINIVVGDNASPLVNIINPTTGDRDDACQDVPLECAATDPEGGAVTIRWSDSQGNAIPAGGFVDWRPTSGGLHVLTCTATDSAGAVGTATTSITIDSPTVSVQNPGTGDDFNRFETIDFDGQACDAALGDLRGGQLVWTSDRDGVIGTGEQFSSNGLSAGAHVIALTANGSQTAVDSVRITINP